jgi:hypothetical protein
MTALNLEHKPPGGDESETESVLDILRAGFNDTKTTGPKHLDLPIPLRNGMGMRFIALDRKLYDEMQRSDDEDTNLDFLAAACECILVKEDGRWRPAVADGTLVKFDGSLSAVTGWATDSPRAEVLKAFGRVPQPYLAIAEHVALVQAWMAGRAEQREEDLLGES